MIQGHLPRLIHSGNKLPMGFVMWFVAAFMYLTTNHFPLSEPQLLNMTWVDQNIPFLPRSVWIYTSEYLYFGLAYASIRSSENLSRYFFSFLSLQAVSVFIFMLWPTTYPRDLYPLPETLDSLTFGLFSSLRTTDTPASCCPSLHVSSITLSALVFWDERRKLFPWFAIWGAAINLSTLTTKQHYLVDVLAGLAMAGFFYWLFHRKFQVAAPQASR